MGKGRESGSESRRGRAVQGQMHRGTTRCCDTAATQTMMLTGHIMQPGDQPCRGQD